MKSFLQSDTRGLPVSP